MKKRFNNIVGAALMACCCLVSCDDNNRDSLDLSQNVDIASFSINGVEGTIDDSNSQINLVMPIGTDLTNLSPQIVMAGNATVIPASGSSMNFSTPVAYTVKNGDLFYKYTVIAKLPEITKLTIGRFEGRINQSTKEIIVTMPLDTDVKSLKPTIEYTAGATVSPASGEKTDFTDRVTYTLAYQGKSLTYQVTVEVKDMEHSSMIVYNGEDVILSWWPAGSAGSVDVYSNPKSNGVNATASCVSIWRNPGDDPWTGGGLGGLTIDVSIYKKFSITILKDATGLVQLELQDATGGKEWLKVPYTTPGEWQNLEFAIPDGTALKGNITTLLVAPHLEDTKGTAFQGQRMYWDEVIAYPEGN